MDFVDKRIVVTGAAGFIGSNLVDELLAQGARVTGLDNFYNGRIENLKTAKSNSRFQILRGDVRDLDFLSDLFKDTDIVFHEAAFTSVPQSVQMPNLCNEVNVTGVVNILNACRRNDVERLVFASSSSVYGDTPTLPKEESMFCDPISPYGVSKLAGERYMVAYHRVYGLKTTSLRYFNVFGPRQKDSPYSGVIAIFMGAASRKEPFLIFGDGTQTRDFTYVKDVINANLLAASHPNAAGKVYNASAGHQISLNDLANLIKNVAGTPNLESKYTDIRAGDILHSLGDISRIKNDLGYVPSYSIENGIKDYYSHFLDEG